MAYHRHALQKEGIRSATELHNLPDGAPVRVAGSVIARQRPGTAKGFVFLSLEGMRPESPMPLLLPSFSSGAMS